VHLTLDVDLVNPYKLNHLTWSTWHVTLLNYNILPWLTTNIFFVMLTLLISGKELVLLENFKVYLQPIVEELKQLWEGFLPMMC
jgi:hypothetical protein